MGQDVCDAFYGEEEMYDRFTISRSGILLDNAISETEKQRQIDLLEDEL